MIWPRIGIIGSIVAFCTIVASCGHPVERKESTSAEFHEADVGRLPTNFWKPVPNSIVLSKVDGRLALTGESDTSLQYQVMTRPVTLPSDSKLVKITVEGRVVNGAFYLAVVDDLEQFAETPLDLYEGPVKRSWVVACRNDAKSAALVLGNARAGVRSGLVLTSLSIEPLSREAFFMGEDKGSAWVWAIKVLRDD